MSGREISEAVVLMAGSGSRLQAEAQSVPKPLLPVLGRPLISYTLSALQRAGIKTVHAVVGFQAGELIRQLRALTPNGLELRFVENPEWQKQNGVSLLAAEGHVAAPFVLAMSDHLFDQALLDQLLAQSAPHELNLAIDRKLDAIFDLEDGMKVQTAGDRVITLGKSLERYDAIDTGLFVCPAEIFVNLRRAQRDGDCSLADGVRLMAAEGKVRAIDIGPAWWQDVDTPEMLAQAESVLRRRAAVEAPFDWRLLLRSALLFLAVFAVYFGLRSPGLDDFDSVLFALGVRHFNLWIDQPHPPGFPIFIFLGWVGNSWFHLDPVLSLHLVAALGGGLFVVAWFLIVRLQFDERFAWLVGVSLALTPAVWMTATKVLTDSLAAGFLSMEILAALLFLRSGRRGMLSLGAILGAAAIGTRPQLAPVALAILFLALRTRAAAARVWLLAFGMFAAASLVWLVPTWYLMARLRPDIPAWAVYPELFYKQWQYGLDKPQVSIFAGGWSLRYFALRFGEHIFGWFGLGFGFLEHWSFLILGTVLSAAGLFLYLRRRPDAGFWRFHLPWALLHVVIIFVCIPPSQRYYLIIFPLLLIAILSGLREIKVGVALPLLFVAILLPTVSANHRDQAPPVRLVEYLQRLYPSEERSRVVLILRSSRRHADWYGPEFQRVYPEPAAAKFEAATRGARAIYTDDDKLPLPAGWRLVPIATFARSYIIHMKYHEVRLYRIERG